MIDEPNSSLIKQQPHDHFVDDESFLCMLRHICILHSMYMCIMHLLSVLSMISLSEATVLPSWWTRLWITEQGHGYRPCVPC